MKDAIVIKVKDSRDKVEMNIETDVQITEATKYMIIGGLMKSLDMQVDWKDPVDGAFFSLCMRKVFEGTQTDSVEVNML